VYEHADEKPIVAEGEESKQACSRELVPAGSGFRV